MAKSALGRGLGELMNGDAANGSVRSVHELSEGNPPPLSRGVKNLLEQSPNKSISAPSISSAAGGTKTPPGRKPFRKVTVAPLEDVRTERVVGSSSSLRYWLLDGVMLLGSVAIILLRGAPGWPEWLVASVFLMVGCWSGIQGVKKSARAEANAAVKPAASQRATNLPLRALRPQILK
ncbi:MAG: hypothetical protein SFY81_06210 [Verrucomicrobiota bacterium]|nr:hypothetical protein [Verrucomicrobiota bacterium]